MSDVSEQTADESRAFLWSTIIVQLACWGIAVVPFVSYMSQAMPMLHD